MPALARAARGWDEQHLDLRAAREQVLGATVAGFTPAVSRTATRFATAWARHLAALADDAGATADGLRAALAGYLRVDAAVARDHGHLAGLLGEQR